MKVTNRKGEELEVFGDIYKAPFFSQFDIVWDNVGNFVCATKGIYSHSEALMLEMLLNERPLNPGQTIIFGYKPPFKITIDGYIITDDGKRIACIHNRFADVDRSILSTLLEDTAAKVRDFLGQTICDLLNQQFEKK